MQIQFDVSDNKLTNFSQAAKNQLTEQAKLHILEIIREANTTEKLIREDGAAHEITENIVVLAIRRNKTVHKKNVGIIILKILSEIFLFISGLLFVPEYFINSNKTLNMPYLIFFIIFLAVSLILTITMHFKSDE